MPIHLNFQLQLNMLVKNKARVVLTIQHCTEPGHGFFKKKNQKNSRNYKKYQAVQKIHTSSFRMLRQNARVQ